MKRKNGKDKNIWVRGSISFVTVCAVYGIAGVMLQFFSAPKQLNLSGGIFGLLMLLLSIVGTMLFTILKKRGEKGEKHAYEQDSCVKDTIHERTANDSDINRGMRKLLVIFVGIALVIAAIGGGYLHVHNDADYFHRAQAGDTYAQAYIADYYHELGNDDDSLYWYKAASSYNNNYASIACNNVAFLYWQKYKASENLKEYLPRIYALLKKSAMGGNKVGEKNLCTFLYYYDFVYEPDENNRTELLKLLVDDGILKDVHGFRQEVWEEAGIIISDKMLSSDAYTRYEIKNVSRSVSVNDKTKIITYYTYTVEESSLKPEKMKLEYDAGINKHLQ